MGMQFDSEGNPYVMWAGHVIKLEKMPLEEQCYIEKAQKELRETEESKVRGLKELRELLKGETTLAVPVDDDEFLLKFLRPTKFYAESAFKKMQAYYKFRQSHPHYCQNLMPSAIRLAFKHSTVSILSPRDEDGRRVMVVESGERWDPRQVSLTEVFRGIQLGLEAAMVEPRTQVCGVVVIMDMKGLTFSHIMQFSPMFASALLDWIQDCIPIRLKAVHIVNQPYIFRVLFAMFKPFLREKLRSRIFFHGSDKQSLLQHVDPASVMTRFGGSLPDDEVSGEVMWEMLHHYEENFKKVNAYGYLSKEN
ncbi:alpha-tocopherol transfer protein-like [Aricia agestis]|uniref:alpha-tocopherol transfer protein-like n=1 Tax=Aricia agestis TaxID=91739 RepID=UPI001C20C09B|nr:alpha-tocopherol transfer protein-like [Aricia agestis]